MHIHILETGEPPAPLKERFGGYSAMFERTLGPRSSRFSFSRTAVHQGAAPPDPGAFDGLLITGSPAGVYDGHDWIETAEYLARRAAASGKPAVGICFGHQLLTQAFGGRVEKSERGWGVGAHAYEVKTTASWMTPAPSRVACAVSHQDQVIEPPAGAQILGGSDFCPNGIIEYAQGPVISFQPHPEFSHDFAAALMRLRKERIPADRIETGLASLQAASDRDLISGWIVNFFLQHAR